MVLQYKVLPQQQDSSSGYRKRAWRAKVYARIEDTANRDGGGRRSLSYRVLHPLTEEPGMPEYTARSMGTIYRGPMGQTNPIRLLNCTRGSQPRQKVQMGAYSRGGPIFFVLGLLCGLK